MSSISNERSSDDNSRRIIEDLKKREAENNKRHTAEMRRITEQFNEEVENLKETHQQQMDEYRDRSGNSLSEKDVNHQNQIEKMRTLFNEQMRKKSEDYEAKREATREAYDKDQAKLKSIGEQQRTLLTKQFKETLEEKDKSFENFANQTRNKADEQWHKRQETIAAQRNRERDEVGKAHDQKVIGLNRQLQEVRQNRDNEVHRLNMNNQAERERLSNSHMNHIENDRQNMKVAMDSMSDAYKRDQVSAREKFRSALEEQKKSASELNTEFQKDINERINTRISSLESNLKSQKDLNAVDAVNRKRLADNQIKNVIADTQVQLNVHREDKEKALQQVNTLVDKEVNKAVSLKDKIIRTQNQDHAEARDRSKTDHQRVVYQVVKDYETELGHTKNRAESQVQKSEDLSRNTQLKQQKFYDENVDMLKANFSAELNAERQRNVKERAEIEARIEKKARETEQYLQRQLDVKDQTFAAKYDAQKETYEKEIRRQESEFKARMASQEKSHRMAMESEKMKFEGQIGQTREVHEKEVERIDKAHRQEINDLAQKMNYLNKKG